MKYIKISFLFILIMGLSLSSASSASSANRANAKDATINIDDLELIDKSDINLLKQNENHSNDFNDLSVVQEEDDLNSFSFKDNNGITLEQDNIINKSNNFEKSTKKGSLATEKIKKSKSKTSSSNYKFSIVKEEKELLKLLPLIGNKIPEVEWNEIANKQSSTSYKIVTGDTLWMISKKFFGTGFYYSKLWSLNSYIKNPHQIEPGMTLIFSSGTSTDLPQVQIGKFKNNRLTDKNVQFSFDKFGDNIKPEWIDQREQLLKKGAYFVYGSNYSYKDINKLGAKEINHEYQKYDPPVSDIQIVVPVNNYDIDGFDENDKIVFSRKTGYDLNTFITTNIVQDLGEIVAMADEKSLIQKNDHVYIKFDPSVKAKPGDKFSIYVPHGKIDSKFSERSGYRYTIAGNVEIVAQKENKWEAIVHHVLREVYRNSRLTILTPKIPKLTKNYNKRKIDMTIIGNYKNSNSVGAFDGDIVYLDRGRLDGIEFGNVIKFFDFKDYKRNKKITRGPTYETGEAIITLVTDNFATALILKSKRELRNGSLGRTQSYDEYLLAKNLSKGIRSNSLSKISKRENQLENLDLELNLSDVNKDLLENADKIELSDDELNELDKQEREKSIIKGQEKDLEELNKIENELLTAKHSINEAFLDEDKYLEQQNLDKMEKHIKEKNLNSFQSMNDLENEIGKKYLDEDINAQENPYGLTKFDLEDIDNLLNKNQ